MMLLFPPLRTVLLFGLVLQSCSTKSVLMHLLRICNEPQTRNLASRAITRHVPTGTIGRRWA